MTRRALRKARVGALLDSGAAETTPAAQAQPQRQEFANDAGGQHENVPPFGATCLSRELCHPLGIT